MRRNRKIPKKMSVVATNTMRFGVIIVFSFVMVILNMLSSSSCTQLLKNKGELERELAKLEDARTREATRWEAMTTPERVEEALFRHGLAMKMPQAIQNVQMRADGTPYPGQPSLARATQRNGVASTARAIPVTARKYRPRQGRSR